MTTLARVGIAIAALFVPGMILTSLRPGTSSSAQLAPSVHSGLSLAAAAAEAPPRLKHWQPIEDFPTGIAQFETVFWDPEDTHSLRELIRQSDLVTGKSVLEIGTGTGLLALCCLIHGADRVVATDINPHAVANARYNAARFPITQPLEVRLVPENSPGAYSVIAPYERFDLIISNPPWEDGLPTRVDDYALYDPGFELLDSLLSGLEAHLEDDGRVFLAYGCVDAIRVLRQRAPRFGWDVIQRDPRDLDDLPAVFLPGMLLELKRQVATDPDSGNIRYSSDRSEPISR